MWQPDFEHVTQHTTATRIASDIGRFHSEMLKQEAEAGRADDALTQHRIKEKGLFSMDGYSEKQVFRDMRFKVRLCLFPAAWHSTPLYPHPSLHHGRALGRLGVASPDTRRCAPQIGLALREAGLADKAYAQQVLSRFMPTG